MSTIKDVTYILISLGNEKKARKAVQIHPIFISGAYQDYILDEIERRDKIEYEINLHHVE